MGAPLTPASLDLDALPSIDLRHVQALTDDTGILQHAAYHAPNPDHGYCTDDNARALILALQAAELQGRAPAGLPLTRYLGFLIHAFDHRTGRFRNFLGYDRRWLEAVGSEDSHARAVWGLGVTVHLARTASTREMADQLLHQALPALTDFGHPRPWAFGVLGLEEYLCWAPHNAPVARLRTELARRLLETWQATATPDWPWWEDRLTWGNARLSHALILAGASLSRADMLEAGLQSLVWLLEVQTAPAGHLSIVGNQGWYVRGGQRARYDQQPLEACAAVDACLAAARATGDSAWEDRALACFEWFTGRNDAGVSLVDPETGGCHDGLTPQGVNKNQGAESSLAYLLSLVSLHRHAGAVGRGGIAGRVLHLGVVGSGAFAHFALGSFGDLPQLRPTTVWSPTAAHREGRAAAHGLMPASSFEAVIADERLDVVYLATPPACHATQAIAALEAGRHVLCEKPLATAAGDAQRMMAAAARCGRRLGVSFMMRHGPLWEPVRRLVETAVLGAFVHGQLLECAGDDGLPAQHWFWDEGRSGGIFVEHGVHYFDLVRSWFGPARVLHAYRTRRPGHDLVDAAGCTLRLAGGATFSMYHGFHQSCHLDRQVLRLVFEDGEVVLYGWVANRIEVRALLTWEGLGRLQALLSEAEVRVEKHLGPHERRGSRRRGRPPVDAVVRLRWTAAEDGQAAYAEALRSLMADFLEAVRDPAHRRRVTEADGAAALELALSARALAAAVDVDDPES